MNISVCAATRIYAFSLGVVLLVGCAEVIVPGPKAGSGGTAGSGGAGGAGPVDGACINDADQVVYDDLTYPNGDGESSYGSEAASAIASDCVLGGADTVPPEGCGSFAAIVVVCAGSGSCTPKMIQDLTAAAVNAALTNAQRMVQEEFQRASIGFQLPFQGSGGT